MATAITTPLQTGDQEKVAADQLETPPSEETVEDVVGGFVADEAELPPGYFLKPSFIGSMAAICLGFFAGVGGFALAAPILPIINADIGPVSSPSRERRPGGGYRDSY